MIDQRKYKPVLSSDIRKMKVRPCVDSSVINKYIVKYIFFIWMLDDMLDNRTCQ